MTSPVLPPYYPPTSGLTRPSASEINSISNSSSERVLNVAGFGERVPIIYGEDRVGGVFLAGPYIDSAGGAVFAIGWSIGEPYGIQGVQRVYIDGAIATHQGSSNTQLYLIHYDGTQVGIDPMLQARIPGFSDRFLGIAYSAIRVPARSAGGFPTIEAVVRGRKVKDPRNLAAPAAWSKNPGLAIYDIVTNTSWGFGKSIRGADAVADRCDTISDGEIRCQIDLTIIEPDTDTAILGLLSTYAECIYEFEGEGVLVVPDAPVAAPAMSLTLDDIRQGTLSFSGLSLDNIPTSMTVTYVVPGTTAEAWPTSTERAALPGVDTGEIEDTPSEISLPAIRRVGEAKRKAGLRLSRLQVPGEVAWQMFDNGLVPEKGDVIGFPDARGLDSVWVRVMSKQMPVRGLYQFTGEIYSPSAYNDNPTPPIPPALLPAGAILPFVGDTIPAGWSRFTDADDKWIKGGSTAGITGGSSPLNVSLTVSPGGGHGGGTSGLSGGSQPGSPIEQLIGGSFVPDHTHTAEITLDVVATVPPVSRRMRLIKRTASGTIDKDVGVFANREIVNMPISPLNYNGRYLVSHATNGNFGVTYPATVPQTGKFTSEVPGHLHGFVIPANTSGVNILEFAPVMTNPPHKHKISSLSVNLSPKSKNIALYAATEDCEVRPGCIIGWDQPTIPAGWRLCSEYNDHYLKFSSPGSATQPPSGDNSLRVIGTVDVDWHWHEFTYAYSNPFGGWEHKEEVPHTHGMEHTQTFELPYYTLVFLEYVGE